MFDVILVRRRADSWRALRSGSLALLVLSSCATASGSAGESTTRLDVRRSMPPGRTPASSTARTPAPNPARTPFSSTAAPLRGPVLDRGAYVREVLRSNPSIESARQGWRAAVARVRQAGAFDDPMLELGLTPLSIASSSAPFGYDVAIRQRLPWFGKRSLEASVALAEASAARSDYEGVKRELALAALTLYAEYFVASRSLEINSAHVQLMSALRDSAVAQLESGHGSAQDALKAEAELTHMEHDAVILASERDVKVAQMNELLHRPPQHSLPPPPAELSPPAALDVSPSRLEAEALDNRPDIAAARQRVRGEEARIQRAEREHYPDVTVSASYSSMWDMPEHRWMVGLDVNLPIQLARRQGALDEARAMRAQYESDVARLTDTARTQVFVLLERIEESTHILGLFERRLLPVARDQIDAARAGFASSRIPFADVIDAERNLRQVELDYQTAQAQQDQRRGELERALGRIPGLDPKGGEQ
jgi:outer membrane protein, heavy metal efflux system